MSSSPPILASRVFSLEDQQSFAALSGDRNPMHLDAIAARRTQAGDIVVHGMHALLWALEFLASTRALPHAPLKISARFKRFLYVGATLSLRRSARSSVRYEIVAADVVAATFELGEPGDVPARAPLDFGTVVAIPLEPLARSFEELHTVAGRFAVSTRGASAEFPALGVLLGVEATSGLAALSALVGMFSPGLHSIFDGVEIAFTGARSQSMAFEVVEADERFRQIVMRVDGCGLCGDVRAFVRQPPVEPDRAALHEIADGEFAQTRALVIGGSRGLGAATVRTLVAGGARVAFTYARGEAEARALVGELGAGASTSQLDVVHGIDRGLEHLHGSYDQLYYFATPQIAGQRSTIFSQEAFASFCDFYVRGFALVSGAIAERSPSLRIYYPSSVYVEAVRRPRDMIEYAMAKAAGETLCEELPRTLRGVSLVVDRLPRTRTDQTASIVPVEMDSAERAAVRLVRRMHAAD